MPSPRRRAFFLLFVLIATAATSSEAQLPASLTQRVKDESWLFVAANQQMDLENAVLTHLGFGSSASAANGFRDSAFDPRLYFGGGASLGRDSSAHSRHVESMAARLGVSRVLSYETNCPSNEYLRCRMINLPAIVNFSPGAIRADTARIEFNNRSISPHSGMLLAAYGTYLLVNKDGKWVVVAAWVVFT